MPPETTQTAPSTVPLQNPTDEPQSVPVIDPVATQGPTEPVPPSTAISETPTMPPVAPEAPTSPVVPETNVSAPPVLEPQIPPSAPVSAPVEPPPTSTLAPQTAPVVQAVAPATAPNPRSFLTKALEKIQFRKRAKLEKIVKLANEKKSITNDQVEKLLHVSDATASRHLLQLVKEGKLKKVGPDGRARYEPVSGSLPTA